MALVPGCPRCTGLTVEDEPGRWACVEHGTQPPLWRPDEATYDGFVTHLLDAGSLPTYLPWPLAAGWSVTDHGWVGVPGERAVATMTCATGPSDVDGVVEVLVVHEDPGVGLGARCGGADEHAPGAEVDRRPAAMRVRVDHRGVALWSLPLRGGEPDADRTVLVGEHDGRWLWLVVRPAAAVLGLHEPWGLSDATLLGPHLVEVPFGGPRPGW